MKNFFKYSIIKVKGEQEDTVQVQRFVEDSSKKEPTRKKYFTEFQTPWFQVFADQELAEVFKHVLQRRVLTKHFVRDTFKTQ